MTGIKFDLEETMNLLGRTPTLLQGLLTGLSPSWAQNNEGPNTWSPYDIIGHLIHGEKTDWMPRVQIILSDSSNKTFQSFDRFAQFENSSGKDLEELLGEFTGHRTTNLEKLKSLEIEEAQLKLTGTHPELGPVTLKQLLSTWLTHDLSHIAQISRIMAKQYKSEVGPWIQFIGILNK